MHFSMPTALLSLLTTLATATPVPQYDNSSGINNPNYQWQITGWNAGCARTCSYEFNITSSAFGAAPQIQIPAFSAYCSGYTPAPGYGPGSNYQKCGNLDGSSVPVVVAKILQVNETGTGAHLAVSLGFGGGADESTYYNYTGFATHRYNAFVSSNDAFLVEPSEAFGVA